MASGSVYCGFWINWNQGAWLGSTLTLPKQWGVLLIAFLALFVRSAGRHLWNIICFAIHQIRATPGDQDDTYHQLQVILRSRSSESRVLWDIWKISWNRRNTAPTTILQCLPLLCIASIHMVTIGAAGLFSSWVLTTSDEALVQSASCGWLAEISTGANITNDARGAETDKTLLVMGRASYQRSSIYSGACYRKQYGDYSSICSSYVQRQINSTIDSSAPCPFAPGACDGPAITIDTGSITSNYHLGINTHKSDTISIRKRTTCAPLLGERYTDGWIPSTLNLSTAINTTAKVYTFGQRTGPDSTNLPNYTFGIKNETPYPSSPTYNLAWATHFVGNQTESSIEPIPDFRTDNGDLIILSLLNTAAFTKNVSDAWFKAGNIYQRGTGQTLWIASKGLTFLGCLERYQLCSESHCTPLTGLYKINPESHPLPNLGATQAAISQLMWKAIWGGQFNYGMSILNQDALLAKDFLFGSINYVSAPPSDTQWQDEVLNRNNISLALLQRRIVEFASPPDFQLGAEINSSSYIVPPTSPAEMKLCSQIKIRTNTYSSFGVLGLFATIAAGITIICVNMLLPTVVRWIQKTLGKGEYKVVEWIETSGFQLQRMACEGRGIVGWIGRESDIPRTHIPGQKFSLTRLSLTGVAGMSQPSNPGDARKTKARRKKKGRDST